MKQHGIEIISDSTCDIPQPLLEEYTITVLPNRIVWGDHQYRDRIDLTAEEFYRRLKAEKTLPTTSQATVADFSKAFHQARERGASAVVAVLLNEKFSGVLQSARQAIQDAGIPVYLHDSRNATMGLGWQVLAAARAREAGEDVPGMLAAAEWVRDRVHLMISLDTLEYVYRGGRIGHASRLVGSMLNIKPVIFVDNQSGVVEPAGMAMTRRKSLDLMYQKFFARLDGSGAKHVAVLHGGAPQDAAAIMERVRQEYGPAELMMNMTGPVLGIHTGPQAVALCGYCE